MHNLQLPGTHSKISRTPAHPLRCSEREEGAHDAQEGAEWQKQEANRRGPNLARTWPTDGAVDERREDIDDRRAQERARNPYRYGNVWQRERERRGKAEQPEDQWRVAAICREGSGQLAKGARERRRHADAQAAHSVVEALEGQRVAHGDGDEGRSARGDSERVIRSEVEEHVGS